MADRTRKVGRVRGARIKKPNTEWLNPYPWMSSIEARVHVLLESLGVPFSWRYFDGSSPGLSEILPDYHPEFTLLEMKTIIIVVGDFFGTLPDVIDRVGMASVILEEEGWKVVTLYEADIRRDVTATLRAAAPELFNSAFKGGAKPNPFGFIDLMANRRAQLKSLAFSRRKFIADDRERKGPRSADSGDRRRSPSRRRRMRG